jgi:hypothetical protein
MQSQRVGKVANSKKVRNFIFLGCTHGNIWTLMKEEINWGKKIGLAIIKKLDWTLVDELVVKEV